ncbi:MAG: MazG nucleotide pyrophosphohydrolase domain-containing protein [Pirellulaceae bacterium]
MSRTYGDQSFKNGEQDHSLGDELADVMFVLVCIANQTGVDLTKAFNANLQKRKQIGIRTDIKTIQNSTRKQNGSNDCFFKNYGHETDPLLCRPSTGGA